MRWLRRLPASGRPSRTGNPAELLECMRCQVTLPQIRTILAPTDSLPQNRQQDHLTTTSKQQKHTGSASYSVPTQQAEPPICIRAVAAVIIAPVPPTARGTCCSTCRGNPYGRHRGSLANLRGAGDVHWPHAARRTHVRDTARLATAIGEPDRRTHDGTSPGGYSGRRAAVGAQCRTDQRHRVGERCRRTCNRTD